jgi:hypothetical protein
LPAVKVEERSDVPDDEREARKVAARARLRIAELLQRPFGVRSIALTGLFILALFYTIYFMRAIFAGSSCAIAELSVEADRAWTRSIEDSAAGRRGTHPYGASCICQL